MLWTQFENIIPGLVCCVQNLRKTRTFSIGCLKKSHATCGRKILHKYCTAGYTLCNICFKTTFLWTHNLSSHPGLLYPLVDHKYCIIDDYFQLSSGLILLFLFLPSSHYSFGWTCYQLVTKKLSRVETKNSVFLSRSRRSKIPNTFQSCRLFCAPHSWPPPCDLPQKSGTFPNRFHTLFNTVDDVILVSNLKIFSFHLWDLVDRKDKTWEYRSILLSSLLFSI